MSDSKRISDMKERVALDLMQIIDKTAEIESGHKDKSYWLTLYFQSLQAVNGIHPERILQNTQPKE